MTYGTATPSSAPPVAIDAISGADFQRFKPAFGTEGNAVDVSTSNGMPVDWRTIAGTALDANSGNKSAGTLRVVLATDQPALTVPIPDAPTDSELALAQGMTGLRDSLVAQRFTLLADSLADGLASFWTSTTANGGTNTSSGGEGLIQTSANANGSAQLVSTTPSYYPGQVSWFNSAVRFGDTGASGNVRRIGRATVSGTTPQNGAYYELNGTTLNAVVVLSGTPTAVASGSWSKASTAPFTLDTNYHSFEIRFTANTFWFYVDNVLRHVVSGTSAALTATLNFPMLIQSINTSAAATNRLIAVRNAGCGGFGFPAQPVQETGNSSLQALAVSGGTPHDSVDSGNPIKVGMRAIAHGSNPTAVSAADRTDWLANRAGVPFVIGGHPNVVTYGMSITTAVTNNIVGPTVASGLKFVCTAASFVLDNASTVFPSVVMGFGTANAPAYAGTPGTQKIVIGHPACPAGGGRQKGDGSGMIAVGGDDEELRITTVGTAGGNGLYVEVSGYTIES